MAIRRKHVRTLVEQLLEKFNIKKAAVPVETIVESLGIEVRKEAVDQDLSGFLLRIADQGKAIIGVNAAHPPNRVRFTLAHELGHFLLHEGETVHYDGKRLGYTVSLRNAQSSMGIDDNEQEANLFAAELLMPAKFLEKDLQDLRGKDMDLMDDSEALTELAQRYEVSVQALTFRLANLKFIEL